MVFTILAVLVLLEITALIWLASTVSSYKTFWINEATKSGEFTYVALGDSAAQGIGATSPRRGYVGLLADRLEDKTELSVRTVNLSKTGATIDDYLREQAPQLQKLRPDIMTIEIGANDIANYNQTEFREGFRNVLASLPDGSFVSNMPLFNSRPSSTQNAKDASRIIEEELTSFPRLVFVDLEKQTSENQSIFGFAPDLFHPNNISYKHWADAFWLRISDSDLYKR